VRKEKLVSVLDTVALWALIFAVGHVYVVMTRHHVPILIQIAGTLALWLMVCVPLACYTYFSKRNQRGALGCKPEQLNVFSWTSFFQLVGVLPLFLPLMVWAAFKKKVGLDV
jgi:hypothetical protein